jgi:hypothetical protein
MDSGTRPLSVWFVPNCDQPIGGLDPSPQETNKVIPLKSTPGRYVDRPGPRLGRAGPTRAVTITPAMTGTVGNRNSLSISPAGRGFAAGPRAESEDSARQLNPESR